MVINADLCLIILIYNRAKGVLPTDCAEVGFVLTEVILTITLWPLLLLGGPLFTVKILLSL